MRVISDTLLAEQRKAFATPYVRIYLPNYSGGTDLTSYKKRVVETEQTYGSSLSILLGDAASWFIVAGQPINLKGQQVDLGWGFTISGSPEYSPAAPYYIHDARLVSAPGVLLVQLDCHDIWQRLQLQQIMGDSTAYSPEWNKTKTCLGIIEEILTGITTVTLDSSDGIVDVFMPYIRTIASDSVASVIARVMAYTNCGIRMEYDGMHIYRLPQSTTDGYTYNTGHVFRSHVWDDQPTIPNRMIVVDKIPSESGGMHTYEGIVTDTASYADLGYYVTRIIEVPWITSNSEAEQIAQTILDSLQRQRPTGIVIVPIMNVGQQIGDVVKIEDPRF